MLPVSKFRTIRSRPVLKAGDGFQVVTLSTVGYGDVMPVTPGGRVVAIALILAGIGVFGFMAGFVTSLMEDPEEDEILATVRRIEARLDRLDPSTGDTSGGPSTHREERR